MPRDLFRDVVDPSITVGTRQWYTVPTSILVHTTAVLGLIVVPLLATNLLPTPQSVLAFAALPAPPPPPPPPPAPPTPSVEPTRTDVILDAAPFEAATDFTPEPERAPAAPRLTANRPIDGGLKSGDGVTIEAPPPTAQKVYPIGGDIKEPRLLKRVEPSYPAVAKVAKTQGPVYVEAIIGRDGRVRDAKATSGAPFPALRDAAVAAVQQWIYSPTTLNGQPVDVQLHVVVYFELK